MNIKSSRPTFSGGGGGGAFITPSIPVIFSIGAISDTTIRITPGFTAYAGQIEVYRSDTQNGIYSLIGLLNPTDTFFDDTTLSASETKWYKLRSVSGVTPDFIYSDFSLPYTCVTLSSSGIERNLWINLTNYLKNDSGLVGYVRLFKFDKEEAILPEGNYPVLKGWVMKTEEMWVGIPKQKIVKLVCAFHGLVTNRDAQQLQIDKLLMSERIKNALEKDDLNIDGASTIDVVEDTIFHDIDSYNSEIFVEAVIWSNRFTAGNR